eukprot:GFYU01001823.1.p1 GENE.GFYU01001823.1~~GFYU01001823.1.p1  ORF type:complete len:182 (+),score=36.87 GFYU01001823.1:95-640(+)
MGGNVIEMTSDADFSKDVLTASTALPGLQIVDFYADWCGPCKQIAPEYVKMSEEFTDVRFLKVNVDKLDQSAAAAGVSAMPTFVLYKGGETLGSVRGADINGVRTLIEDNRNTMHEDVAKYSAALGQNINDTDAWIGRARGYLASGLPDKAMADCKNGLRLDPDHTELHKLRKEIKEAMQA